MKTALLLLVQVGLGLLLYGVNPNPFGLIQENPQGWLALWLETVELFSLPFCLLLFSFSKKNLFIWSKGIWGFWSAFVSLGLLGFTQGLQAQFPDTGILFVAFYGIIGLSLFLHAGLEWMRQNKDSVHRNASQNLTASPSVNFSPVASQGLPKVEGA